MEKADNIIKAYFKDFKGFKANWLVKVTWENMTVGGSKKEKVRLPEYSWLLTVYLVHLSYYIILYHKTIFHLIHISFYIMISSVFLFAENYFSNFPYI